MKASLFLHNNRPTVRLLFFVTLSVVLMFFDQRTTRLEPLRHTLASALYPLQVVVDLPSRLGHWMQSSLQARDQLLTENRQLRAENLLLASQLQRLRNLQTENQELRDLLHSTRALENEFTTAHLMAVSMNPFQQRVVLNKGRRAGILPDMPVLDRHGVMGQVVRVYPFHAEAILISDPDYALPVQVARNHLRAILSGTGYPTELKLLYVPITADIQVGDQLSTSGLAGRYPANYPVAVVTQVQRLDSSPFAQIMARPLAELDRSREVLLVNPAVPSHDTAAPGH